MCGDLGVWNGLQECEPQQGEETEQLIQATMSQRQDWQCLLRSDTVQLVSPGSFMNPWLLVTKGFTFYLGEEGFCDQS